MKENACLYMRTLAAAGSITRAAAQLYVTPSALSKYISSLEKEAGSPLFSRVGNHFVLTYAGKRYLDWCERMESLQEQMDSEMLDLAEQRRGKIRFGVQTSVGDFMLTRILPAFAREYPGVDLSMMEEPSVSLLGRLRHYEIDAVLSTHVPEGKQYHIEELLSMEQILLVPSDSPLPAKARPREGYPYPWIDIEECAGERVVLMHRGQAPRAYMEACFAPVLSKMRAALEVRQLRSMFEAVEQGLGIMAGADGMEKLFAHQWRNLTKLSFGEERPAPITFYLSYQEEVHRSQAAEAFYALIRQSFRELGEEILQEKKTPGRGPGEQDQSFFTGK